MIKPIVSGLALFISLAAAAQDDLMKMLAADQPKNDKVLATFKSTKIINANTTEFLKARNLDFRVSHRFSSIGTASGGSIHNLYGFDNSQDIRISFEYGVFDNLMIGVSRSKMNETYEGFVKYGILQQTTNNHIPVSVAFFANNAWNSTAQLAGTELGDNTSSRASYIAQLIIARKFSRSISFELLPTYFHRNYVADPLDHNDIFALGAGGRIKVTRSSAIVGDYFYNFSNYFTSSTYRSPSFQTPSFYPVLGLGWELETGGHVFTLMLSNNGGIIENNFLTNTTDSWGKGGFKFSFIISRVFKV